MNGILMKVWRRCALVAILFPGFLTIAMILGTGERGTGLVALAQTPESAGLRVGVVVKGLGGRTSTYCVTLAPEKNTGLDALQATGIDMNLQIGPLGAAVCRLQNIGCTSPAENCFCQCQGSRCNYWTYHFLKPDGQWQYSSVGLASRQLKTGDVEGWLWSESGNMTPAGTLPSVTFDSICEQGPTAKSDQASIASESSSPIGYLLFGALGLALGGLLLWRRRRSR